MTTMCALRPPANLVKRRSRVARPTLSSAPPMMNRVERGGLAERFYMYNWSTSSWSLFTGVTAPTTDTVIEISSTNLSQFIAGDGGIRAKIRWTPINDENPSQDGWLHSVDVAKWTISP